jgi:hypothetical protein
LAGLSAGAKYFVKEVVGPLAQGADALSTDPMGVLQT